MRKIRLEDAPDLYSVTDPGDAGAGDGTPEWWPCADLAEVVARLTERREGAILRHDPGGNAGAGGRVSSYCLAPGSRELIEFIK